MTAANQPKVKNIQHQEAFYSGRLAQNLYWQSNLFNEISLKFDLKNMVDYWKHHDPDFDQFLQGFKDLISKTRNRKFEKWNEVETIKDWIVPILDLIGWDKDCYKDNVSFTYSDNRGNSSSYRPDLLYMSHSDEKDLILVKKSGDLATARQLVKMVVEAKSWRYLEKMRQSNCNSEKKAPSETKNDISKSLPPEDQLLNYQNMLQKDFGILTDGAQWKLLHRYDSDDIRKKSFNFNLEAVRQELMREKNEDDIEAVIDELKYFYYLFRKEAFYSDQAICERLLKSNKKYVAIIIDDMKENFVNAMSIACNGFSKSMKKTNLSKEDLDLIRNTAESHLFNIMFIKSCEANDVLKLKVQDYLPASLTEAINLIEYPNFKPELSPDSEANILTLKMVFKSSFDFKSNGTELYDRLRNLYSIIEKGTFGLLIPGFGETVFTNEERAFSKKHKLTNDVMVQLLFHLGYVKIESKYQQIPYNYFSPRQLGSIYESFLEYKLNYASDDLIFKDKFWQKANLNAKHLRETKFPSVKRGNLYFSRDLQERKNTGSYYTPDFIVRYLVDESLSDSLIGKSSSEILKMRVCDPAMGSSHFLNAATEYLTKAYRRQLLSETNDDLDESFTESARKVLGSCIYGVDINPRAVKLSKMALWLVTAHAGSKLEPLSDQLVCHDSLADSMKWGDFFKTKNPLESGIFDAIIGNPPYIGEKGHKELFEPIKSQRIGKYYQGKMDYFYFFVHLGLDLLKDKGRLGFITTNYFMTAHGARILRGDLHERSHFIKLINLGEWRLFKDAQGQHNAVFVLEKDRSDKNCSITETAAFDGTGDLNENESVFWNKVTSLKKIAHQSLFEGDEFYIRTVGNSDSNKTHEEILRKMTSSNIAVRDAYSVNTGIQSGADKLSESHLTKYPKIEGQKGDGIFVLSDAEVKILQLSSNDMKLLKPFYKNSDVEKYSTATIPEQKIIYLDKRVIDFESMPRNLKMHIQKYRRVIDQSVDCPPYLHRPRNEEIFCSPKIVAPQRSKTNTFGYNELPWYASADVYFITSTEDSKPSLKALLGILNSKLLYFWLYHKGKRKGESLELYQKPLSEIPLPKTSDWRSTTEIEVNVNKILKNGRDSDLEAKIDVLVYALYCLSAAEIAAVEKFFEEKHTNKLAKTDEAS